MNIADLKVGQKDGLGAVVQLFYARNPPLYAVYGTDERVAVQYADDTATAATQRKAFTAVNPLRGEINGLIDTWRNPSKVLDALKLGGLRSGIRQKAQRYDRRVGDALTVAFEEDVPGAVTLLTQIKQDLVNERTAWARLQYVVVSLVIGLAAIAGIELALFYNEAPFFRDGNADMLHAAVTGALGAFFSIALAIKNRTVLPDFQWLSNWTDAALRMIIGIIAAAMLMALIRAGMVNIDLGPQTTGGAPVNDPVLAGLKVFIIGFIGGFSERLVPDLLAKVSDKTDVVAATPAPAAKDPAKTDPAVDPKTGAPAAAGEAEAADEDPLPEESAHESCPCDAPLAPGEETRDEDLPPAAGGVAKPA
jgi:hypothetical protein